MGNYLELAGLVLVIIVPLTGSLWRWSSRMDRRMDSAESRLELADQRFDQLEVKISEVSDNNVRHFEKIESKIDRLTDHLLNRE